MSAKPDMSASVGSGAAPLRAISFGNPAVNIERREDGTIYLRPKTQLGDYPVRIYTIGMGNLAHLLLGTMPETPESILQRIANDPVSPDHNSAQLDGKYFYAATAADETVTLLGALLAGDWPTAEAVEPRYRKPASGIVAAYLQWHLERSLRSLVHVER